MTEPLLRQLHARGERLVVGALPWVAPVYRAMPQVAEVIDFPFAHGGLQWTARRAMARALRGRFDVAYVCPNSLKSALLPWWAGIPRRVGYLGESRYGVLNQRLPNPQPGERPPMVPFYAALAQAGYPMASSTAMNALSESSAPSAQTPVLQIAAERQQADLAELQLQAGAYFTFAPGAEYGPAKRWPVAHFATLALQLPLPVVLLGSAKDASVCEEIAQRVQAGAGLPCINLAGRTRLDQALSVIAAAKGMVSNDSGLMHVAAAFSVPQVAMFGSSSPLHTPPLNTRASVLWLKNDPAYEPSLDCAPCFARDCTFGHTRCLQDIAPARVLGELERVLV